MGKFIKYIWLVALLFITFTGYSQDSTTVKPRPKVGLVLSGGGAKGAAHIGVLKYIEEAGIPIDYIAGTSMGSIVGGMHALGYSADEILDIISNVDWNTLISNNVDRKNISYNKKAEKRTNNIINVPFSTKTDEEELQSRTIKNSLPKGIVSGDNLINLFNSLAVGYADSIAFSDLPTPFICIATNMINGEADVLRKGEFTKSLRASMAIPILFDPIMIGDTMYVDGGMVSNFPAEQCRAMGADYVIGVSMSPGLESEPKNLTSVLSQIKQLKEIITDKDFNKYHELCDIFISPDLKGVGMLSFDAKSVATVVQSGYEAALNQKETFDALKEKIFANDSGVRESEVHFGESVARAEATDMRSEGSDVRSKGSIKKAINIIQNKVMVSAIELNGVNKELEKWMLHVCSIKPGDYVNKSKIDELVSVYYGTGDYESITYTLHQDPTQPEGYILRFNLIQKAPHNIGIGFRFDSKDMLSVLLNVGINSNRMNGFKADLNTKLGSNQWLKLNLSYGRLLYPKVNFAYHFRNSELDVYDMDELVMNMKFLQHKLRLYLSENYSRSVSIGMGFEAEFMKNQKVMYSLVDAVNMDYKPINTLGAFAYLDFDNLNQTRFPSRGVKGTIDLNWKINKFTSKGFEHLDYGSFAFGFEGYIPVIENRLVLIPQLYGSFLFGEGAVNGATDSWNSIFKGPVPAYPYMNNIVGGPDMGRYIDHQLPFIGLKYISMAFNNVGIVRTDVRTRLFRNHYITAIVNYARSSINIDNFLRDRETLLWGDLYDYNASNWWGAGVRYSIDTKIGPLSFDINSSNISRKVNLYFSLGFFF